MQILERKFENLYVLFNEDGWINGTALVTSYEKRLDNFFQIDKTQLSIEALMEFYNFPDKSYLIQARKGRYGGTWLQPDLAIFLGMWLDPKFGAWCVIQIRQILEERQRRIREEEEWVENEKLTAMARIEAATGHKLLSSILTKTNYLAGVETVKSDYQRESMLINELCGHGYRPVNRDLLTWEELKLIAALERFSAFTMEIEPSFERRVCLMHIFVDSLTLDHLENFERFVDKASRAKYKNR